MIIKEEDSKMSTDTNSSCEEVDEIPDSTRKLMEEIDALLVKLDEIARERIISDL